MRFEAKRVIFVGEDVKQGVSAPKVAAAGELPNGVAAFFRSAGLTKFGQKHVVDAMADAIGRRFVRRDGLGFDTGQGVFDVFVQWFGRSQFDPRIQKRVEHVDDQVEQHQHRRIEQHHTQNQKLILIQYRIDKVRADAGYVEYLFHHE